MKFKQHITEDKKVVVWNKPYSDFHVWKKDAGVTYEGNTLATKFWENMKHYVPDDYDYAAVTPEGKVIGAWSDEKKSGYVTRSTSQ